MDKKRSQGLWAEVSIVVWQQRSKVTDPQMQRGIQLRLGSHDTGRAKRKNNFGSRAHTLHLQVPKTKQIITSGGTTEIENCYQNFRFRAFFSASVISSKKLSESLFSFSKISSASLICMFLPERDTAAVLPYLETSLAVIAA
jgi:hypothetical protein